MTHALFSNWKEKVIFTEGGPIPQILEENDQLKVIVAGLQPGQSIPEHPENLGLYYILEGSGWMTVDGERMEVNQGAIIVTPHGAARGMEADTRLAFLAARVA